MARRVFFSFHYAEDIWRVSQVRKSGVTKGVEANHPIDAAQWESIKRVGDAAVKRWIDQQLAGTSVTVVLIGSKTSTRPWVLYEIQRSLELKKGLLGITIHDLEDQHRRTSLPGQNPLDLVEVELAQTMGSWRFYNPSVKTRASTIFKTYDWKWESGYLNFPAWVDEAARIANR